MVLSRIITVILAVIAFLLAWRLLDAFLGVSFGVALWVIKALLFIALLFVVYRLFIARRPLPTVRR